MGTVNEKIHVDLYTAVPYTNPHFTFSLTVPINANTPLMRYTVSCKLALISVKLALQPDTSEH